MKYTQIPADTFQNLQLNAGILVDSFTPASGVIGNLIGATTGGIQFQDNVSYSDFGDDIDNCPKNMKELKHLDSHDVSMSGTFVSVTANTAGKLAGAADVAGSKVTPRNDLLNTDFSEVWWIGDYSDVNTGANAGYIAIRLMNALNTGGFSIQSTDRGKGQFAFTFTGHYSIAAQDTVPYEIYVKGSSGGSSNGIVLNTHTINLGINDTYQLTATVMPAGTSVTWASAATATATCSGGLVTGKAAGNTIVTASITVSGVTYNDTCTVIVTA